MPDPLKSKNRHVNADVDDNRNPSNAKLHQPFGLLLSERGNQAVKDERDQTLWFPGKLPPFLDFKDPQAAAPVAPVDQATYILLDATVMDVDEILWQAGTTVRILFNGGPTLPVTGDWIEFKDATNGTNNGRFQITADDPAFVEITNPLRPDATDDEVSDSPATAKWADSSWDGVMPQDMARFIETTGLWGFIAPQQANDAFSVDTETNWFFTGGAWVEEILSTAGLFDFKGDFSAAGDPNYPVGVVGDAFFISVAGKVGGAAGKVVAIGDTLICKVDNGGGTEAAVGTDWYVAERNQVAFAGTTSLPNTGEGLVPDDGILGDGSRSLRDDGTWVTEAIIKSGVVAAGAFAGNPKTFTVVFAPSDEFPDANYSVSIIGIDSRAWSLNSVAAANFVINSNANPVLTGNVYWIAIQHGSF